MALLQCFGSITDKEFYEQTDLSQTWRTWEFQVCTQWGFFMVRSMGLCTFRMS